MMAELGVFISLRKIHLVFFPQDLSVNADPVQFLLKIVEMSF